ncbi:MAG: hypothetical protein FWH20_09535 [Oscillospiraceae bacterium]|nr:hypothetical protein [Oscillospiraceae bacterium]
MSLKQQIINDIDMLPENSLQIISIIVKGQLALNENGADELQTAYNAIMKDYRPAYEELAK